MKTLCLASALVVSLASPTLSQSNATERRPVVIIELAPFKYNGADAVIIRRPAKLDVIAIRKGAVGRGALGLALHDLAVLRSAVGETVAAEQVVRVTSDDKRSVGRKQRDDEFGELILGMLKASDEQTIAGVGRGKVARFTPAPEG